MKKKKLKVKWENVILVPVLLACIYIVIHDSYMLTIHSWITGQMCGWTLFGFITFLLSFMIGGLIIEHFYDECTKKDL